MSTSTAVARKVTLSGIEKIAILMNVLGKEKSFEMMKEMKDGEVRRLLKVMGSMRKAPIELINAVLREYLHLLSEKEEIFFEDNLARPDVVTAGLGEDRAKQIFGNIKSLNLLERKQFSVLESVEPKKLAEFLIEEHPQTIALVIAHMEVPRQIAMLRNFPEALRPEIILRMASLEYVAPEKLDELDEVLKRELQVMGKATRNQFGGIAAVAELVNSLDKKTLDSLLGRLEDKDPILLEELKSYMFQFTDIIRLDVKGLQAVLREVPNEKLLLALKSAPDELRDKISEAMSERAAAMLREDLGALGPQKVKDVETAQREIVTIVKRLESEGKIMLGGGGGGDSEVIP